MMNLPFFLRQSHKKLGVCPKDQANIKLLDLPVHDLFEIFIYYITGTMTGNKCCILIIGSQPFARVSRSSSDSNRAPIVESSK